MYCGSDFTPAGSDESLVYAFDFVNDLGASETITNAVWSITVSAGVDDLVMHRLQGAAFIYTEDGAAVPQATKQRIGGLQPGVMYCVKATVITSDTDVRNLYSHIYGEEAR